MRLTPCIVFLAALTSLARADVYLYKTATTHVPHEVISSSISFFVTHPFRVVVGGTDQLTGVLSVDLKDLSQGVALELTIPTASLQTTDGKINARIARILNSGKNPSLKFVSSRTDITHVENTARYDFIFDGHLELGDASSPHRIDTRCRVEGGAFVCEFNTLFAPTSLGIPLPKLAGIVTPDKVEIGGLVTFRAEK